MTPQELRQHGIEDAGFEAPRYEIPAESAQQQACSCFYDCAGACKSGCYSTCLWACAGNPTLQTTLYSNNVAGERTEYLADMQSGMA
jgi:hypothetical protein